MNPKSWVGISKSCFSVLFDSSTVLWGLGTTCSPDCGSRNHSSCLVPFGLSLQEDSCSVITVESCTNIVPAAGQKIFHLGSLAMQEFCLENSVQIWTGQVNVYEEVLCKMCPETFLSDGLKSQMKCISDSWSLTALLCDVNQILLWCLLAHSLVWLDGEFQACAYSLQSYPTQAILLKAIS